MSNIKKVSLILFPFLLSSFAYGQVVQQVKDNRLLIDLENKSIGTETKFFLVDSQNKKKAQIEITKVNSKKAVATVIKGKAAVGMRMLIPATVENTSNKYSELENTSATESEDKPANKNSKTAPRGSKWAFGFMTGLSQQTITLTVTNPAGTIGEGTTLSGSAFPLKVFADYTYNRNLNIRLGTGLEPFNTKGSLTNPLCEDGTSVNCKLIYNYWALEGQVQYNISTGRRGRVWVGGGYSYLFAVGSSVNVPNIKSSSSSNQLLLIGTGLDLPFSSKSYLPLALEYGTYPGSSAVTASAIFLRIGYGMKF